MRIHASLRATLLLPVILAGLILATPVLAQTPITLSDAIAMALEKNPAHRQALAQRMAAQASIRENRASLLPRVDFSELGTRSNDPVFVFGTRLRQQRFSSADFALDRLNRPTPIGDFSSRFSGQWTIFDSFQNVRQVHLASLAEEEAGHALDRADQELVFRVTQAYYAVLLAAKNVDVAEASLKTAQSVEDRSRTRVESGIAVNSDLLSAQTSTAERKQDLVGARNDLAVSEMALALAVGVSPDEQLKPVDTLAQNMPAVPPIADLEQRALANRPELKRMQTEVSAQETRIAMAKSAFGPKINAFGSWQTDSPSIGWNGGNNWTAGVEVQMDLFDGGARRARLARAQAMADEAGAARDSLRDAIRLEVRRAYYDLDTARQQVEITRAAIAQAQESLRINQNRYDSGLSTVTELLRAEEASDRAQNDYWNAVYRVQTSSARLALATGTSTAKSGLRNRGVVNP